MTSPQFVDRSEDAGITFSNDLSYTEDFNPYTYKSYFNGGGVALGDINNDGLLDVYFTGNLVDNKLYINKGNWVFEDITDKAGVACPNVWSSGATFADVNSDGLQDLYVCKSGKPGGDNRHNELFINQGDLTFIEQSKEYGLDIEGLSTHAAFFDYDKDGDLDCYVLTNSIKSIGGYDLIKDQRNVPDPQNGGNKFLVNHNNRFFDSTVYKGIYTSEIGFGLGITLSDFNGDSWTDIFVSNDFFERDYLYLNQKGEGFEESLETYFGSISMGSMGADAADLNNDLLPDLFVTEMLPREIENQRTKTIFESWDKHQLTLSTGYFHQYSRNVLQMNTPDQKFVELGRYGDVSATDWSWGALMFDFDNDGLKDIFVSNGIFKDLLDRDYLTYSANDQKIAQILKDKGSVITDLLEEMPTTPVPNRAFVNTGNFGFRESANVLGLGGESYSNGSAYGDLDNDGDYDLIVNNVGTTASVYENRAETTSNNSITIALVGDSLNRFAVGARVLVFSDDYRGLAENYPSRGFQSSVDNRLIIGIGNRTTVDSLLIEWPNGALSSHYGLSSGYHKIAYDEVSTLSFANRSMSVFAGKSVEEVRLPHEMFHHENEFVDFDRDRLLPMMFHNQGPGLAVRKIEGNEDVAIIVGGSKQSPVQISSLKSTGIIERFNISDIINDSISEDNSIKFADFNGDGFDDLFIASGGRAFSSSSSALVDRVYLNDGHNGFFKSKNSIPRHIIISTGATVIADFDEDGDQDIFLAERFHPIYYGSDTKWYLLINDGSGMFSDRSKQWFKGVSTNYMATDAKIIDLNGDNFIDIAVSTDWGPVILLEGTGSGFIDASNAIESSELGWWSAIEVVDIDFDGDDDIIVGNHGANSFFTDSSRLYIKDFDQNGTIEYFYCIYKNGAYYPIADRNEIISQLPGIKKRILYFKDYAEMTIEDLLTTEVLEGAKILQTNTLKSKVFVREGARFIASPLPWQLQLSPIYAIESYQLGEDKLDIFFGGNQYLVKPQFGRYDALPLSIWHISGDGESTLEQTTHYSQIRNIEIVNTSKETYVFTASTDDEVKVFKYK